MRLEPLCTLDLQYVGGAHVVTPYGNESGLGWGVGDGTVQGDRLTGDVRWSNHPTRRGDGTMLPNTRGLITTGEGAEVFFDLTGRTVWVEVDGSPTGRQLLMALFESDAERYRWLNNVVCIAEGAIDPERLAAHFAVHICHSDLA
jgi:hypothetical protein